MARKTNAAVKEATANNGRKGCGCERNNGKRGSGDGFRRQVRRAG